MDRSKGYGNFDTINKLGKQFLPSFNEYVTVSTNTASHNFSIRSIPSHKPEEEGLFLYFWDGSFSLRIAGTMITLHPTTPDDHGFINFEEKLRTLKDEIQLFIDTSQHNRNNPDKDRKVLNKRTWLNGDNTTNLATGYVGIRVDRNGGGQVFIADCHRTINLFIYIKKEERHLVKIIESIDRALTALFAAREAFDKIVNQ